LDEEDTVIDLKAMMKIMEPLLFTVPGLLVTDAEGRLIFVNKMYEEILGYKQEDLIGKFAYDVIPGSRMHIVAKTGKEEVHSFFRMKNGEWIIVNRLPIRDGDKIVGAMCCNVLYCDTTFTTFDGLKRLMQEMNQYKTELNRLRGARYSIEQIVGSSRPVAIMKELIAKIALTKSTVLITGETGTGKELVAHAIHQSSSRSHQPFIRINCAAIPPDLLESELFGYDEGAFTGARKGGKLGKFELADHGTLLLDEINQMPLHLQPKLLRVLQEKEIERVGGTKSLDIDVRVICTTNKDLSEMVENNEFREDLYYRINVAAIDAPPLRSRGDDIPLLVEHFIAKMNRELGLHIEGIADEVMKQFEVYDWPGNIRELENTIERAANIALSGMLTQEHFENLYLRIENRKRGGVKDTDLSSAKAKAEKVAIMEALKRCDGNITLAAKTLGIHRTVLHGKIRKYKIKN
jgi:PAS domain S-box-containing protein